MSERNKKYPGIKKSIQDFIDDEDGSITRSKLVTVGSMVLLMAIFASIEAQAAHSSHKSHSSHSSHSSTSYSRTHGSHESHESHSSHTSSAAHSNHSSSTHSNHSSHSDHGSHSNHSNHASHTSHANTSAHSNSLYSNEGDVTYGPDVSEIPGVETPQSTEAYAKITLADKINITAPVLSDTVNGIQPSEMQATDITEGNNE
jgi:hypothetical protein